MSAMVDLIVMLWFVPVTLLIVLPLAMFCGWTAYRLIAPANGERAAG